MKKYYPIFLDLENRHCVVIGGGVIAERKVRALLSAGAFVRLISPTCTKSISCLHAKGRIELLSRRYAEGDLKGASLVFAATGSDAVNSKVREEALRLGIPLNVADNPQLCDFIVPSIVKRDPILIAISTSGVLPMLSKKLRQEIGEKLPADYVKYARLVGAFRKFLLENVTDNRRRREIMKRLGQEPVPEVAGMTLKEIKERFLPDKNRRAVE